MGCAGVQQCLDMGGDQLNRLIDVDLVCTEMRMARNQMVQTEEQYMCIHSCTNHTLGVVTRYVTQCPVKGQRV